MVTNASKGDAGIELAKQFPADWDEAKGELKHPIWMSRYQLRDLNDSFTKEYVRVRSHGNSDDLTDNTIVKKEVFKAAEDKVKSQSGQFELPVAVPVVAAGGDEIFNYVRIRDPGDAMDLTPGQIVPASVLEAEKKKLQENTPGGESTAESQQGPKKKLPTAVPVALVHGTEYYQSITLLPHLQYTVPLLLIAVALWFAWRIVNFPVFADFLIATEAELNKVSWVTRRRLIQDTIVVLVTVSLMAVFLFAMDQTWSFLLSWPRIGVIQLPPKKDDKNLENRPW
jgi:preprotein translocase SecE subunit